MKYLKIGIWILFFLALGFFFLTLPRLIPIKKITCANQYGPCEATLSANLEKIQGKSLFTAKKEIKAALASNLLIKDFSLQYQIPNTLQVYLILKKPKFALWSEAEKKAALVEEKGLVLAVTAKTNLPKVIIAETPPPVGETVPAEKLFALNLISDLNYFYQTTAGVLAESWLEIFLGGKKVIFPLEGDRPVLLGALKLILSQLNAPDKDSKMEKISVIDLRFKNPILK